MRQIFVDSRDRTSGTSSNFSITLPQTLSLEGGHQGRIDDLRIPSTIPTISLGNNTIEVLMGSSTYTVTIPTGNFFDGASLAAAIRNELQAVVPGSWTGAYDTRNITMSLLCTNPFTFTGGTYMSKLLSRPYVQTSNTYTFSYVPLAAADVLYLCCTNFTHMDSVGPKGASDCLCSIPITAAYGSVQDYSMSSVVWFDIPALTTQQLSFQLRDRDYNILSIVPNISFTLTID